MTLITDFEEFTKRVLETSNDIRWVAIGSPGEAPQSAYREGIDPANPESSDEAEERIVNPALLTIAESRGEWDIGGVNYLIISYGKVTQLLVRLSDTRHLSVSLESVDNAQSIAESLIDLLSDEELRPLQDGIPEPEDDGGADHLVGSSVPSVSLQSTDGSMINLSDVPGTVVVYCFPKMGRTADEPDPDGWESIPGAYGCTEEACSFRDHYEELVDLGVEEVFGLSLQSPEHQQDAHDRVRPQFEFLSDSDREFTDQLQLPTFEVEGEQFNKRLTLVIEDGQIEHVFYPVFPPDKHAQEVIHWLESRTRECTA